MILGAGDVIISRGNAINLSGDSVNLCTSSIVCHFCKHVFNTTEEWDKLLMRSIDELEHRFFRDNNDSDVKQYLEIGRKVINEKYLVYKQVDNGKTSLIYWGERGKKYERVFVVVRISSDCADKIITTFRKSNTSFAKILNIIRTSKQYDKVSLYDPKNREIVILVSPEDSSSYKAIEYYDDEIISKYARMISELAAGYESESEDIFKLVIYLQMTLENNYFKYLKRNSDKNLIELVKSYSLYKNCIYSISIFENENFSSRVFVNKYENNEAPDISRFHYDSFKKRHEYYIKLVRSTLYEIINKNNENIQRILHELEADMQNAAEIISLHGSDISNVHEVDDDRYYFDLICMDYLLNHKISEHVKREFAAGESSISDNHVNAEFFEFLRRYNRLNYMYYIVNDYWF